MTSKRSRLITIGAAGALAVATAVSVTAVAWPGGPAAKAGTAAAFAAPANLATVTRQPANAGPYGMLAFQQYRSGFGEREYGIGVADAKLAAARKAAAARATARKAAGEAAAHRAARQQAAQHPAAQQPASAPAASGSPQQIAGGMLGQFGWSSGQFSCLFPLWERESGWNVSAENPSSGAYGIPQALPGSKMASAGQDWETDAATQIRWGLSYIKGTYGSPCGAWAHEEVDGWY